MRASEAGERSEHSRIFLNIILSFPTGQAGTKKIQHRSRETLRKSRAKICQSQVYSCSGDGQYPRERKRDKGLPTTRAYVFRAVEASCPGLFPEQRLCFSTMIQAIPYVRYGKDGVHPTFLILSILARITAIKAARILSMAPILAAPWITGSVKASPATKRATVKPIPAIIPATRSSL
jgi:hypothetical protein